MSRSLLLSAGCLAAVMVPITFAVQDAKELKLIASTTDAEPGLVRLKQIDSGVVIRSAQELVAHSAKPESAKDAAVQKAMEADLAKRLKVDSIDWSKHMVLVVQGHPTKGEYGTIKIEAPKIQGKMLVVTWKQENRIALVTRLGPPVGF